MSFKTLLVIGLAIFLSLGAFMFSLFQKQHATLQQEQDKNMKNKDVKKETFTFIALGDSLTAGYLLDKKNTFSYLLEQKLNQKFPQYYTQVINAGINGSTTSSALSRLRNYISFKPQVVLIALGSNDGMRGIAINIIEKNLEETIQLAKKNNIKVILAGMKIPLNYGEDYRIVFEEIFTSLAQKYEITYVPFLLEGVAMIPEYNLSDGIHPNEKGHKIITQTLYPYFKNFYP